ncbi:MAG: hypothetical protein RJA98_2897 [Pseudomonadota bacterium]|jgi:glyoxylase-like metal-dependent hydrolase (beta-lactamase superfamily II)
MHHATVTASAADWYRVTPMADGVTLIDEQHIDPFYRCNIWHIRGRDGDLLVDSGLGVVSLLQQMPFIQRERVLAVASHAHFDHIGNHHEFAQRAIHRCEAGILAEPTAERTLADRYATVAMFTALPPGGFDAAAYRVPPAPATRLLEKGDVIDLGDRHLQVLHLPGHSPGSIALWEAATGTLFSGDTVYDGPLIDDAPCCCVPDYIESMVQLQSLPVRTVHGGHFPSFGAERYRSLISDYLLGKRQPGCPAHGA